jgi:hypothetical protein
MATPRARRGRTPTATYTVFFCDRPSPHVHLDITERGQKTAKFVFSPDDTYDLANALLRGYDIAVGIEPSQET